MKPIYFIFLLMSLSACSGIQSRYHEVQKGESLWAIAKQYQVPVSELKSENGDELDGNRLYPGMKLYIPFESSPLWNVPVASVKPVNVDMKAERKVTTRGVPSAAFTLPVYGARISSYFGKRKRRGKRRWERHEGMDFAANKGTPVYAARSGHVIYASNGISGYGNLIILRHPDRFSTVYAHLSKFHVRKGQYVRRGQRIGRVGSTGRSTGNHLHFEIRNSQRPVDPMPYLETKLATRR